MLTIIGTMKKKIIFILNPISGTVSKAGIPKLIEERLDKETFDYDIAETEYAGHATELAKKAAEKGVDITSLWLREWTCTAFKITHEPKEMYRHN